MLIALRGKSSVFKVEYDFYPRMEIVDNSKKEIFKCLKLVNSIALLQIISRSS